MQRKLIYQGFSETLTIDLDHRAEPMHVAGSIMMDCQAAVGLPLKVEAEIRPDGEIVLRRYEWSVGHDNTYWHCARCTLDDIQRGIVVVTDDQRRAIWQLWSGTHQFRDIHDNGVGATLLGITGQSLDDAVALYLDGVRPALA